MGGMPKEYENVLKGETNWSNKDPSGAATHLEKKEEWVFGK